MAEAISGSWQMPRTRRRFSAKGAALLAANSLPTAMSSPAQQEFSRRMQMVQAGILKPEQLLCWYFGVDAETAQQEYLADNGDTVDLFGGA